MSGNVDARLMVPVTAMLIVSAPLLLPAAHSPAAAPEAALVLAAVIASRSVHKPSLLFATSAVLFTTMVFASGVIPPLSGRDKFVEELRRAARSDRAVASWLTAQSDAIARKVTQNKKMKSARTRARSTEDDDISAPGNADALRGIGEAECEAEGQLKHVN